jgi:dTDP-4-dehydrorhamnose reductase
MVDDQTSVPTTSTFLASHTMALLKANASGLLHLVPSGQATRYEFALEVVKASRSGSKVAPAKSTDFPAAARRPAYSVMDNRKAAGTLGQPLPQWRDLIP